MASRWRSSITITTTIIITITWCRVRCAGYCMVTTITTTTTTTIRDLEVEECGGASVMRRLLFFSLACLCGAQQMTVGAVEHRIGVRRPG